KKLRPFVRSTNVLTRMRNLGAYFLRAMRNVASLRRRRATHNRRDRQQQENQNRLAHQTALPRIRSAARRASDSESRTIFSRAPATSRVSCVSASEINLSASAPVRSSSEERCADASERKRSRSAP